MGLPPTKKRLVKVDGEWLRVLVPNDFEGRMEILDRVLQVHLDRAKDPHVAKDIEEGIYPSPRRWMETLDAVIAKSWRKSVTMLFNRNGGWRPLNELSPVEGEMETEVWPLPRFDEIFQITRWSGGNHFYVSSQYRSSNPLKFATEKRAVDWCKSQNPAAQIKVTRIV